MISCARGGDDDELGGYAAWAAMAAVRALCRFASRGRREAYVFSSLGVHATLVDALKGAVESYQIRTRVPQLLSELAEAIAVGVEIGGAFSRTTVAEREGMAAALAALGSVACAGIRVGSLPDDVPHSAVMTSIRRLMSVPTVASAAPVPILAVALAKRLEFLVTLHGYPRSSTLRQSTDGTANIGINRATMDQSQQGGDIIQEVTDICTTLAIIVGATELLRDDDVFADDDDFISSPAATALVASGAVSGLVDVLGGAGWERWDNAAVEAAGATLQYVVRHTAYGPGKVIAAGCIAKAAIHIAAPSTHSRAHTMAASRVMAALSRAVGNPLALCVLVHHTTGHITDAARMGAAALGLIHVLRERDHNPADDSLDGMKYRDQLAPIALTAAWLSVVDTIAIDHDLESSSPMTKETLVSALTNDMNVALEVLVLPSECASTSPAAYLAAVAAITWLPVSAHVTLGRRLGLDAVEAVIGTKATAAAAAEMLLATCIDAAPIAANNPLLNLARVAAAGEPSAIDAAALGLVGLLKTCAMGESPRDDVNEVELVSTLTLLLKESGLSSAAIGAIKKGVMSPLALMLRRPTGSRDNAPAAAAVQSMHVILHVATSAQDTRNSSKLSVDSPPEVVLSLPTADDLVSIIDATATGHFNDTSNAAIGVVEAVAHGDGAGHNRAVMLQAGLDRAMIQLARREEASRPAAAAALLALCPGPIHDSHSAALGLSSSLGRFKMFKTVDTAQTHASVVLSLLQLIGWLPEEGHERQPMGVCVADGSWEWIPAPQIAIEALIGLMLNDGAELVEEETSERNIGFDHTEAAASVVDAGAVNLNFHNKNVHTRKGVASAAEQRLDAWAKHTHVLLTGGEASSSAGIVGNSGDNTRLHPSIDAALRTLSPRALSTMLIPRTAIITASTMGIDALPAIVLLGGQCARAKDTSGLGETLKAIATIDVSLLGSKSERPAVSVTALLDIETGCAALDATTFPDAANVFRTMRGVLQTMIASGVVRVEGLTKCAIHDLWHHAQMAVEAFGAGETADAHVAAGSAAIELLCSAITSAKDDDDRRSALDVATSGGAADAAGLFMDVDAGSGAALLTSLAAVGVGAEGAISKSPAAAAAAAASRAAKRSTASSAAGNNSALPRSHPHGVMSATTAMLQLLDMRGGDGVAASEATQLIDEAVSAALELLNARGIDAEAEGAGALAAILAALTTAGVKSPTAFPQSVQLALVRNGHASTLAEAVGERSAVSISASLVKRTTSELLRDDGQSLWWMPGAARALAELVERSHDMLAVTAAVEAIPDLILAVTSVATSDDIIATAKLSSILEAMVVLFTASPKIIAAAAESGATEVMAKMLSSTRAYATSEVVWLMSELLGGAVQAEFN